VFADGLSSSTAVVRQVHLQKPALWYGWAMDRAAE